MSVSGQYPTTAWTLLRDAQNLPPEQRVRPRNEFIGRYWRPVFYSIRQRRYPTERAEDLTQDFLLRMIEKDLVAKADHERGRFRSFLLTNLKWFLSDQGPHRGKRQVVFEQKFVPVANLLCDEDRSYEPASNETPDSIFMKKWARDLVNLALQYAEQRCKDEGRPDWWFKVFAAKYGVGQSAGQLSQENLAQQFGQTRDKVRTAQENVEKYFVQKLREEVCDQVESQAEVEEELRELLALLGQ